MTPEQRTAWNEYSRSLERLVMIGEPQDEKVRAAFVAGYEAARSAGSAGGGVVNARDYILDKPTTRRDNGGTASLARGSDHAEVSAEGPEDHPRLHCSSLPGRERGVPVPGEDALAERPHLPALPEH